MKIIQIVTFMTYGDGVSNCMLSISEILDELDYSNIIITFRADQRIQDKHVIEKSICERITIEKEDIIIYHFAAGHPLNYVVENLPCKKILVYHNVTEPDFFRGIDYNAWVSCLVGKYEASKTVGKYQKCIVLSEFSKNDLLQFGWRAEDISVLPLIKNYGIKEKKNLEVMEKYSDGYTNILFVGRIVPQKKIEDVIKTFNYYHKNVNSKSRLILVGQISEGKYYKILMDHIQSIDENVLFTGHVSEEELEAYYAVSDIFLCMSEHEGFCIPLVEAMKRKIPIIAYSAAAIPDTLGGAGILVDTKDEEKISKIINRLTNDEDYRESIIQSQTGRVSALSLENHKSELKKVIEDVNEIEKYLYNPEYNEFTFVYPDDLERQRNISIDGLGKVYQDNALIVIYGIGRAGKLLLSAFRNLRDDFKKKLIICDNQFEENNYEGVQVLQHKECVERYPDAMYILTVQNNCVDIIASLLGDHILKENIKFFNLSSKRIV